MRSKSRGPVIRSDSVLPIDHWDPEENHLSPKEAPKPRHTYP